MKQAPLLGTEFSPPGPRGNLLTGNLFQFTRDPLGFLEKCAQEYGDIVRLRFATVPVYFINHPEYIEYVLVTNQQNFVKGRSFGGMRTVFGKGLFTSRGESWLRQRRLAQAAFHRSRIPAYGEMMVARTQHMLERWTDGESRDLHQEMTHLSLDIVTRTLFGPDVKLKGDDFEAAVKVIMERSVLELPLPSNLSLLLPPWIPTPTNSRFRQAVHELNEAIYCIIRERKTRTEKNEDLLSLFIRAQDGTDFAMTEQHLRDEVTTLLLTGHETSACALSWTWYLLSQRPDVEHKLEAELDTQLGGRAPNIEDLPHLPYTRMLVMECLRLYPPGWGMNRWAVRECEIGGYRVPAGSAVLMSQWVMHRDPRYFDHPAEFNPDRWAGDLDNRLPKYAYFPFGGGSRFCIGREFAMLELILLVATIAQRFRFRLVPGCTVGRELSITLRPRGGVHLVLSRR